MSSSPLPYSATVADLADGEIRDAAEQLYAAILVRAPQRHRAFIRQRLGDLLDGDVAHLRLALVWGQMLAAADRDALDAHLDRAQELGAAWATEELTELLAFVVSAGGIRSAATDPGLARFVASIVARREPAHTAPACHQRTPRAVPAEPIGTAIVANAPPTTEANGAVARRALLEVAPAPT